VQACLRAEKLSKVALTSNWGDLCSKERFIDKRSAWKVENDEGMQVQHYGEEKESDMGGEKKGKEKVIF